MYKVLLLALLTLTSSACFKTRQIRYCEILFDPATKSTREVCRDCTVIEGRGWGQTVCR